MKLPSISQPELDTLTINKTSSFLKQFPRFIVHNKINLSIKHSPNTHNVPDELVKAQDLRQVLYCNP